MSIRKQTINEPDLDDVLYEWRNEIFANMNCIQIGKISKVNDDQTANVEIQVKRRINNKEIISYPLLLDCPIIVLQGGKSYIELPIQKGDYCLCFFNDRNIDDWWETGDVKEPRDTRKHNLSDAFVLVGINPKTSTIALNGTKIIINAENKEVEIKGSNIKMLIGNESFVKGDTAKTELEKDKLLMQVLQASINGWTPVSNDGGASLKAALTSFLSLAQADYSNILSEKIKGE